MLNQFLIKQSISEFLKEDLEFGDLSTAPWADQPVSGYFIAKQAGIICGQQIPQIAYDQLGKADYLPLVKDGQQVTKGMQLGKVTGTAATVFAGERVILNLLQHLSGIAGKTAGMVKRLADDSIKLVDTRKTTPGLRLFEKYAVTVGGGYNHRFGLTGGIMLKDNHLALAGGPTAAIAAAKRWAGPLTPIEVEVENRQQLLAAINQKPDVIMFDNQTPAMIAEWQKLVPAGILTEASGGITDENIAQYHGCGVDFISSGSLTNDVKPLDISFLLDGAIKNS